VLRDTFLLLREKEIDTRGYVKRTFQGENQKRKIMARPKATISFPTMPRLRIAICISVAILTSIPFLVMNHIQHDATSRRSNPQSPYRQRSSLSSSEEVVAVVGAIGSNIAQLSCRNVLADANVYDPNKGIPKNATMGLTTTEPQFYISLHNESL
jgi:hypothetical protein